ncbi:tyrosine-type recombinase/integrase [Pedobacter xixiisoli]|uniref:Site-specific recombinase XerD n=1 Tax=Pedobacter xixiisoli TaxID=1476464 RepID=A0A286ACY8_9SPHI|nr:site-specific integrase [Pedobacter xixiisoli]SOD19769.1 Site-specific recombinase XerD [Pedobacter xixiisoli]
MKHNLFISEISSSDVLHSYKSSDLENLSNKIFLGLDLSKPTITDYKYRIGKFVEFIKENGFERNTLLNYKRQLHESNFSISTKNKYFISAKIFLRELYRLDYLDKDITVNIKGFKQNQGHKKDGLTEDDILIIQEHCKALTPTSENLRLKALLAFFLFQGLRQIEVCRMDINDIDLKNKCVFITGKGRDDKEIVWLHPYTVKAIKDYINIEKINTGAVFKSKSNFCNGNRLTTKSIGAIIKALLNDLDIDGTTHGFRHFFTTKLIKNYKGELLTVSKYTRHRSIQMLEVYNDEIIRQADLPRFYNVFNDIKI